MEYVFFILLGVAVFVFGYVMIQAKLQRRPHAQPPKEHGAATYAIEKGNQGAQKNNEKGEEEWTELKHCRMTKIA